MKELRFAGGSRKEVLGFPEQAKKRAGYELRKVQAGLAAQDTKPMSSIGPGVEELRIWVVGGTFRVIYVARFASAVYVLHAFEKKTQTTSHAHVQLARERYKEVLQQEEKGGTR